MSARKSLSLIEVHGGENIERHYVHESEFVVGRGEDVAVLIRSPAISRHHFQVNVQERSIWIADLGSSNGTKVASFEIEKNGKIEYAPGEPIRFGDKNMYVMIHLLQTPLEKHEAVDEILHDAFLTAEKTKAAAVEEAKVLAQAERLQALAHAQQEAQATLLQAEQQVRFTRESANQQIAEDKAAAHAEISKMKMEASKENVQKMEDAQKQIDQTLAEGLKRSEEKALKLEQERRATLESEIQKVLSETRVKGRQEVDLYLKNAQEKMRVDAEKLKSDAQEEARKTIREARGASVQLIRRFRVQRSQLRLKLTKDAEELRADIQNLQQKQTEIQGQVRIVTDEVAGLIRQRDGVVSDLAALKREREEGTRSFEQARSEMNHQIQGKEQQLHDLKNQFALSSAELKKGEAAVAGLNDRVKELEKRCEEFKTSVREMENQRTDSQHELLRLEQSKRDIEAQIDLKATAEATQIIRAAKSQAEEILSNELAVARNDLLKRKALYAKEFEGQRNAVVSSLCNELESISKADLASPQKRSEISKTLSDVFERLLVQTEIKSIAEDRAIFRRKRRGEWIRTMLAPKRAMAVALVLLAAFVLWPRPQDGGRHPAQATVEWWLDLFR